MPVRNREILLTQRFFPENGGSIRWFFELFSRSPGEVLIICHDYSQQSKTIDLLPQANGSMTVLRGKLLQRDWGIDSLNSLACYWRLAWFYFWSWSDARRVFCARLVPEGLVAVLVRLLCLRRTPVIAFAHGEEVLACESSRQLTALLRFVARRVDVVIANSQATATLLAPYIAPEKILVCSPGISETLPDVRTAAERNELRRQYEIPSEAFVLITVARLESRKNHQRVLEAVAALKQEFPQLFYCIVGSGSEQRKLEEAVQRRGLESSVRLFGETSDQVKQDLLESSDLFVMPSIASATDTEGFGMVFLEAAAAGVPSICGAVGGQSEAVLHERSGLVVDGESIDEICNALRRYLEDRSFHERQATAARAFAATQSWTGKCEQIESFLSKRGV
jgi:phosphatidylinositol alpha-1,6-mannosyltransferase